MVTWQLTIDSNDPARMARFWAPCWAMCPSHRPTASIPGWPTTRPWSQENLNGNPDDYIDRLVDPAGEGPKIWFQPVPEKKAVKTRFHFDIYVADRTAPLEQVVATVDAKVAELIGLGATIDHETGSTPTLCSGTPS